MINKFISIKNLSFVSKSKVLDTSTGLIHSSEDVLSNLRRQSIDAFSFIKGSDLKKEIEIVDGVDKQKIDFSLATSDGNIDSSGFLIEVFLSGSDGKLTQVYDEDVIDLASDDNFSEGFSNYLVLEVDQ